MKVVTIAASKGGTTKTTMTLSLAVRAVQESKRVAMLDLNGDQGDLTKWWILRGEPINPKLLEATNISRDIEALRTLGCEWLFIDTPPLDLDIIENAILKSDVVVIPVRTSMFDIGAVGPVVEICQQRKKPYAFLLSAVDARMTNAAEHTAKVLLKEGPVFVTRIGYRASYMTSIMKGMSAAEVESKAKDEIEALWADVKRLAGIQASSKEGV